MNIRLAAGGAVGQPVFSSSSSQFHPLGTMAVSRDGRKFRYVKAGSGAALVAGNTIQAVAQNTSEDTLTPSAAAAIGATAISLTLEASAVTANEHQWIVVDTTVGEGYTYKIKSHPASAGSEAVTFQLDADTPVQVALATGTSRCTLVPNPWGAVIQTPITTLTGKVVGVAVFPIAASEFGWLQTHGPCGTLVKGTPAVGCPVSAPGSAAGAVVIDAGNGTTDILGQMMVTGVDGKILPVYLEID